MGLILCGFTPVYSTHDTTDKVDIEVKNIENSLQDQQFKILISTPNLRDLKDGEVVIISSGPYSRLMYRAGQEIFSVQPSCVTVRR